MLREMEEEEEVSVSHFIHEHPLTLMKSDKGNRCYGCRRLFMGEAAYGCKECGNQNILHQECIEMPREIRHPKHPQHTLLQKEADGSHYCSFCDCQIGKIGYFCSSSECEFQLHMECAPSVGLENAGDQQIYIKHPSHPQHQMFLITKRLTFSCDACSAMETGRSYICLSCQYCIHEKCAALPLIRDYHHHHHPLSLSFDLPPDYSKYLYPCDVCGKELLLNRWIYHCQMCRYIAHIKCVVKPSLLHKIPSDNANTEDGEGSIQFPVRKFHEEVIKPFVMGEIAGEMCIPRDDQKYMFSKHRHELCLVSLSLSEASTDDDEYDQESRKVSEIICDACTMPIIHNKGNFSSTSSDKGCKYYMSCEECKFFLHVECFHLPTKLSSHPLHHKPNHTLILATTPKLDFRMKCSICNISMNGLIYSCTECNFKADIKCVCMPKTIKHEAHSQHYLHAKFWGSNEYIEDVWRGYCSGCNSGFLWGLLYKCGSCDFTLCHICIMLPAVSNHEGDKHPLPLTYHAHLDHPEDFYCDGCEQEMNPREWMYHCRDCDTSYHPCCFPTTSSEFRNIKYGFQSNVPRYLHPHPLTFQIFTTKLRCDVCGLRVYGKAEVDQRGFHCSSCNFFMCYARCGSWRTSIISAI